jgi:hypothetical protein
MPVAIEGGWVLVTWRIENETLQGWIPIEYIVFLQPIPSNIVTPLP